MSKKEKKPFFKRKWVWALIALVVIIAVMPTDKDEGQKDATQNNPGAEVIKDSEADHEKSNPVELNLDWDKLSEDFKADPSVNDTFVKDVYAALGDDGYIQITAVLADATAPEVALDYADTLLRRLNGVAQYQDSSIASGNTEIFGGLYDVYGVQIAIAPLSKKSDSDEWFVFDAIAPGVQCRHTIELQKSYR